MPASTSPEPPTTTTTRWGALGRPALAMVLAVVLGGSATACSDASVPGSPAAHVTPAPSPSQPPSQAPSQTPSQPSSQSPSAPESIDLQFNVTPGLSWTFDVEVNTVFDMRMIGGGQSADRNDRGRDIQRGRIMVEASSGGRATQARVDFDPSCGMTATSADGSRETVPFALAGRSVRVTIDDRRIQDVAAMDNRPIPTLTPAERNTIAQLVTFDPAVLPGRPIRVGDAWTSTESPSPHVPGPRVDFELRLAGLNMRPDGAVAELDLNGTLTSVDPNQPFRGTVSGRINVDVATGLPRETRTVADLNLDGDVTQNGVAIQVRGTGRSERRVTIQIGDSSAVAAGNPLGRGPANPTSPARPTNPADPDAARHSEHPRGAPPAVATDPALAEATKDWKTFRHPAGGTFRHPADWTLQTTPQGLIITPADARPNEEVLIGLAASARGHTDPMSPALAAELDTLISTTLPGLRRSRPPTAITTANTANTATSTPKRMTIGSRHHYDGIGPDGRAIQCEVFVKLSGGTVAGFSLAGFNDRVNARAPVVERMFRTIAMPSMGAPAGAPGGTTTRGGDARLVGMFRGETISTGEVYVNTQLVYAINANGTLLYGAQSAMSTSERGPSGNVEWSADGVTDGSVRRGQWSTSGWRLTVDWRGGGRSVFRYGFEPDGSLVLRNPTNGKLINFFPRVR